MNFLAEGNFFSNIGQWIINNMLIPLTRFDWWVYLIAGAILMILFQLIVKKMINKFKGFIIAILIIAVVVAIVGLIIYFVSK